MAIPRTRQQFGEWCLRKLGAPVIQINLDDEQVDDRIDEALAKFRDYHFDGTERYLYKHQVTAADKATGQITMPDGVNAVVGLVPFQGVFGGSGMFNVQYQFALNDMWSIVHGDFLSYHMAMTRFAEIDQMFIGTKPFRYTRATDKLKIDMDWTTVNVGDYLCVDCYMTVDPEAYADVWDDAFLKLYATALIKQNWGNVLKKHGGIQLVGGITFNGQQIYDEATEELKVLDERIINEFSDPPGMLVG